jgi:crotonobetainyl-CoA:carnitine CoA-transferase CaiB-like acyl-CoA transferase
MPDSLNTDSLNNGPLNNGPLNNGPLNNGPLNNGPLKNVTVLDLSEHIVGPYGTKLFADYGANVIKVERPMGDPSRRLGPFKDDDNHPEKSGTFFYFNINKRSVVLDLKTGNGREAFWALAKKAHVIVESFRPGVMDRLGLGWEEIHERYPALPLVSVSNFGQHGPYRDYRGSDLVLYGFGGEMFSTGMLHREPIKMYGTAALVQSGSALSTAIMGALFAARNSRRGQHVDFSIADSHLVGVDRRHSAVVSFQYSGRKSLRAASTAPTGMLSGVFECADGWISIGAGGRRFMGVREFMGRPSWLDDPKWDNPSIQVDPDAIKEFHSHLLPWLRTKTKREVWEAGRRAKFICGPLYTVDEVFSDPVFQERGLWQEASTPEMGEFRFPGRPFLMSATPWEYRRPAPKLGEHTQEVLAEAGLSPESVEMITGKADVL